MPLIFFLKSPSSNGAAERGLVGARDIASKLGWVVRDFDLSSALLPRLVEFWKPAGVVVECGEMTRPVDVRPFGKTPVVFIDHDPSTLEKGGFNVLQNAVLTGEVAARELMLTGYRQFAFVPFAETRSTVSVADSAARAKSTVAETRIPLFIPCPPPSIVQ